MRLRVSDPETARDLAEFLRARIGAVVQTHEARDGEFEVSLLGSFGEAAMREEIGAAVRQWSLARQQPGTLVELE
jgi:hypothetical protein